MIDVAGNVASVRERVARAAERSGRSADRVRIVAVSKTKPAALITEAIRAGITDIGENYVQEAAPKIATVTLPVVWHLIGHLQRNKAGRAVELFDVIQTLDTLALADALDRHGEQRKRSVRVLIEVNVGGEASKSGVAPERVADLAGAVSERRFLELEGLMTVPPPAPPETARAHLRALRRVRETLAAAGIALAELSMGMTDDFEVAIEEGATMVRIGRAIFGPREN